MSITPERAAELLEAVERHKDCSPVVFKGRWFASTMEESAMQRACGDLFSAAPDLARTVIEQGAEIERLQDHIEDREGTWGMHEIRHSEMAGTIFELRGRAAKLERDYASMSEAYRRATAGWVGSNEMLDRLKERLPNPEWCATCAASAPCCEAPCPECDPLLTHAIHDPDTGEDTT